MALLGLVGGAAAYRRLSVGERRRGGADAVFADHLGSGLRCVFFDERPDWATGMGAAIIILSGIYVVFREDTEAAYAAARPAHPEPLRHRDLSADNLGAAAVPQGRVVTQGCG